MSNEYAEVKLNANIHHGNATVIGTESGYALPGGKHTHDPKHAKMMAIMMAKLMTSLEVGK